MLRPEGMTRSRWLLARMMTRHEPVRFPYHAPAVPAGLRVIYMYDQGYYDVGTLVWTVCGVCHLGSITKISISVEWQRQGLGRRLVLRALRDGPGYTWITTHQSPEGMKLFQAISAETGVTFNEPVRKACEHMDSRREHADRWPKPVIDRSI
jgi:hypothetical protein